MANKMETKKIMKYLVVAAIISFIFTECKKKDDTTPAAATTTADDAAQQTTSATDQSNVENESNKSLDDVNSALDGNSALRTATPLSNVTIDSSTKATGLIKLTFTGKTADSTRTRSGSVSVQLPYNSTAATPNTKVTRWSTAGATITLTYTNYKVTNLSNNKSLTLNGTHTITNVSGGRVIAMTTGTSASIVHKIRGNMVLTFDDGTIRTWNVARKRTFTNASGVISTTLAGDTTINSNTNVAMWGTNRAGENFSVSITTPIVVNVSGGSCLYKPLSGVRVHHGLARELTVTYGVDASGTAVSAGTCPYGYKINWTNAASVAKEVIASY